MKDTGSHDRFSELIGPYLRRELSVDDARDLEEHLATCPECRAEMDGARALISGSSGGITEAERRALHAAVTSAMGRPVQERTVVPLTPRWGGAAKFLTAAAAVAVVVAGGIWAGTSGVMQGADDSDNGGRATAEGGGDGGAAFAEPEPSFLSDVRALSADASGNDVEATPRAAEEQDDVAETEESLSFNALSQGELRDFAEDGPLFKAFANAYVAPIPREDAQRTLMNLAGQAPAPDFGAQVEDCARDFLDRTPGSALSVAAILGSFEGEGALVIGFVINDDPSGELNRYTYEVWRIGDCTSPITTFGGALVR